MNAPGLIDAGYRGEIEVLLVNHDTAPVTFERGARIAQLVIQRVEAAQLGEREATAERARGVASGLPAASRPVQRIRRPSPPSPPSSAPLRSAALGSGLQGVGRPRAGDRSLSST